MRDSRRIAYKALSIAAAFAVLGVAACDKPPVEWNDPLAIQQPAGSSVLVLDSAGSPRFVEAGPHPVTEPTAQGLCRATLQTAAGTHRVFAGWWSVRRDSSSVLFVAWSTDSGRTWGSALPVDTTDVSSVGCTRPPPAITAVGDDVYVAYSMIAPEGKGVFFAHTMGSMLHSPVPVIYGERLVSTAIAADERRVAVAYEEPNGTHPQIDVAISATQGHIFEVHLTASRSVDDAVQPAVAFRGSTIAVSWLSQSRSGAAARVVRTGRLQ